MDDDLKTRRTAQNLSATRKALRLALAISVAVPLLFLLTFGYFSYQRVRSETVDLADRLSDVAQEQALKVLDLDFQIASRTSDLVGSSNDAELAARQEQLHDTLDRFCRGYPQVNSVSIWGQSGALLVNSRYYPVPEVNIGDRADYRATRDLSTDIYVSPPLTAAVSKSPIFTTMRIRRDPRGRFLGVISVALDIQYFSRFYQALSRGDDAVALGLYRLDGTVLVRMPPSPVGALRGDSLLMKAIRDNRLSGQMLMRSTVDERRRIVSFKKVGDYPLYVAAGYSTDAVFAKWLYPFAAVSALVLAACAGVWTLVVFSLRRVSAEQAILIRLGEETLRRSHAEAAAMQTQRLGALTNLVSHVAHEVNNLLAAVTRQMLVARAKDYQGVKHEVEATLKATAQSSALGRRLLSVTRQLPLHPQPLHFASWLGQALPSIQGTVAPMRVAVDVPDDLWPFQVDPTELELAVINAALNASDASSTTSVAVLFIRAENVKDDSDDEWVVIRMSDNGEGMTESVKARSFDPFFTTKRDSAGLGLSQLQAACESAGGHAELESIRGEGTTVSMYFPRWQASSSPPIEAQAADISGAHVLLVEDNQDVADGMVALLSEYGAKATHVTTADDALVRLGSGERFTLVLSDVQMPGKVNGLGLAEWMVANRRQEPVVLMTGFASELRRARELGITVWPKPFDMQLLFPYLESKAL
ncbi:ATP-binding protein [Pararobbsia alpina]|uniref:hybrid sensor histidine kinase/response regulator n=1 Tax=Pararobbsia alpina TaxID=621374 RepID=UPI0039A67D53